MCETRREKLADTGDLFRFLNMVRDLMLWMEDTVRLMNTSEKPRYFCFITNFILYAHAQLTNVERNTFITVYNWLILK